MTPKERFLTAVRRGTPDVVPVAPLIHERFAHKLLGRTGWQAQFDVHKLLGSIYFRGSIHVGFDVEWPDGWTHETHTVEQSHGLRTQDHIIRMPAGTLRSRHVRGMIRDDPLVGRTVEYLIKNEQNYRLYQRYLLEWVERAKPNYAEVEKAHSTVGDEGIASVAIGGVFNQLGSVRGMEGLLGDLYDAPGLVEETMEIIQQMKRKEIEAFLNSPAEVLYYDICWASASTMSPEFFKRFVVPELQAVVEIVKGRPGKYVGYYMLGKMKAIMPMVIETCPDYVETFEPNQGDLSLRQAKTAYGDRISVMGNYDCVVLARGTIEDARNEALRCLREGKEGGGYVMVTGDEVPADAKMDNLRAMVETVAEHGRY